MRYKTILVHCNDLRRVKGLLTTAITVAEAHGAHIIGLNVLPPVTVVPAGAQADVAPSALSDGASDGGTAGAMGNTFR